MGQALYRTYRSKSLAEIIGQEHITQTLGNALKEGHISHAYLLTGPRGVGKTSIARILAHEINQLPYDGEALHLDIIEIDAASNNGVEDVRDLREKVMLAPTSAKYKVYIIDEVHMLSGAAFNALLKTLEEPPAHVVFILATTEVHKLPATIISRTQRFQFSPIAADKVVAHLRNIAQKEKINISDDALELVAAHGEGAFRDSISLLDQLRGIAGDTITAEDVEAIVGLAPRPAITQLLQHALTGEVQALTALYNQLVGKGINAASLAQQIIREAREQAATQPRLYNLIDSLIEVPRAYSPKLKLEVVLAHFALESNPIATPTTPPSAAKTKQAATPKKDTATQPPVAHKATVLEPAAPGGQPQPPPESRNEPPHPPASLDTTTSGAILSSAGLGDIPEDQWQAVVAHAKENGPTLYTVVRQAIPYFDPAKQLLTITFRFPLHQKRLEEARHKQAFTKILQQILGTVPELQIVVNKNAVRHMPPAAVPASTEVHDALPQVSTSDPANVINLMGGGEVVSV